MDTNPEIEIRKDLDGNDITMEIFLEAKKDMIACGILDENDNYSYDDYCNQCQDL